MSFAGDLHTFDIFDLLAWMQGRRRSGVLVMTRLSTKKRLAFRDGFLDWSTDHPRFLRIIVRELLPNVMIPMGAFSLLGVAIAIVAEGSLAFLGLSVEKGPTWGKIILTASQSSRDLENAPYMAFFPIGVLFLTVLALNFAGDRIRGYFDVRELSL